ncbi:MAG: leucine-rich repeat domain-containing protein, partial [Eubacteriales bacterium]
MKKVFIFVFIFMLIFSVTSCSSNQNVTPAVANSIQPSAVQAPDSGVEASAAVQTPAPTAATGAPSPMQSSATAASSHSSGEDYNPYDLDDWDQAKQTEPTSNDPMAICNLFPDPYMAYDIAQIFNKKVNDTVTIDELASYSGELDCSIGQLENITGIGYMTGITVFTCCKNNLTELPDEFGKLKNLTALHLQKAFGLEKVTPEIKNCVKLKEINFAMTSVEKVPAEIGQLKNLQTLDLNNTPLASIPPEIGGCSSLESLDVSGTAVASVPDSLCNLTGLKTLILSHTKIASLPENIGNLAG